MGLPLWGPPPISRATHSTTTALPAGPRKLQLEVPYFTQLDSLSGHGTHM
jgi:hypothetical protein